MISCFAKDEAGTVVGGAIGRWWGDCCELQQLWVAEPHRQQGIGKQLMDAFETKAKQHGCKQFFLETFSFQSPEFYKTLGYSVDYQRAGFPQGIVKYLMSKSLEEV
ncbi:MAG: GNAT family N-acetyltransferase [Lacipirellulaceae bacterium]